MAETGRFDGGIGLLLLGNGKGGFAPMPTDNSGILAPGDARALAVADLNNDGRPDFFVTRNNDRTMVFLNRGRAGRNTFAVTLHGKPGNPNSIGSRLTLELSDRSTQTAEVSAGSGCFSQSTPTVFFGYPDPTPPVHLTIRWPDGTTSERSFASRPPARLLIDR